MFKKRYNILVKFWKEMTERLPFFKPLYTMTLVYIHTNKVKRREKKWTKIS